MRFPSEREGRFQGRCSNKGRCARVLFVLLGAAVLFAGFSPPQLRAQNAPENPFPSERPKVPPGMLSGGVGWLNTSGPIEMADLRGKVVLFDFWTYCCINCIHILPDLKYLEQKYPNELVVIGIHSAKFENEKDSENISRAIQRYEIMHPVINDANMAIWNKFNTRSWPTLALVDPEGHYLGSISGEGHRQLLDDLIGKLVAYHKHKGTLDTTPVKFALEREKLKPTPLRFPGKVRADEAGNRLFISDSNHNRIVIASLDGKVLDVIGNGQEGLKNGSYTEATFNHPQGMELVGDVLYVADTENHVLRKVDLKAKTVDTLAGIGEQSRFGATGGPFLKTALNSPWALAHDDGTLYIAMAGPHQIWAADLAKEHVSVFAGSGREDIINGGAREAALAQPSGLAIANETLFVVDSEGSSVRAISLGGKRIGRVATIAGTSDLPDGRSLFEFGDVEGPPDKSRLQHPLGIAAHDGTLYIADTYNHKIKRLELKTDTLTNWLGSGKRGDSLDPPQFSEPAGLSIANGKLYIADTNNHVVKVADLKTGAVSLLTIDGLNPPELPIPRIEEETVSDENRVQLERQIIAAGDTARFDIAFKLPAGYKLNALAPVTLRLKERGEQSLFAADALGKRHRATVEKETANVSIPLAGKGKAIYELTVSFGYCRDGVGGVCKVKTLHSIIPIEVADKGEPAVVLTAEARE
ncbi:MAG: thioredoxin-like domain-containing protein [Planctomycetaceae bacterium]